MKKWTIAWLIFIKSEFLKSCSYLNGASKNVNFNSKSSSIKKGILIVLVNKNLI